MGKIVLFMHITLDGFVAGPNGEMDWILLSEELFDHAKMQTDRSDTAIYGRVTYEMMESYWPTAADKPNASKHDIEHSAWYNNVGKVVISKSMKGRKVDKTQIISENIPDEILKIKSSTTREIVIFGSPSVCHLLMNKNMIDEFRIFVNPVLLGKGIPLFKDIGELVKLNLLECKSLSKGVVPLHYELK